MTAMAEIVTETPLTPLQAEMLASNERAIEEGKKAVSTMGKALACIRDERLYRADFASFDLYCRERWSISRIHAHRLIEAVEVAENLKMLPIGNMPANEAQIRPLTALEPDQQAPAWERAQELAAEEQQPIAARHVQAAVAEVTQPPVAYPASTWAVCARCNNPSSILNGIDGTLLCPVCQQLVEKQPTIRCAWCDSTVGPFTVVGNEWQENDTVCSTCFQQEEARVNKAAATLVSQPETIPIPDQNHTDSIPAELKTEEKRDECRACGTHYGLMMLTYDGAPYWTCGRCEAARLKSLNSPKTLQADVPEDVADDGLDPLAEAKERARLMLVASQAELQRPDVSGLLRPFVSAPDRLRADEESPAVDDDDCENGYDGEGNFLGPLSVGEELEEVGEALWRALDDSDPALCRELRAAWAEACVTLSSEDDESPSRGLYAAWSFVTEQLVGRLHAMVDGAAALQRRAEAAEADWQNCLADMGRVKERLGDREQETADLTRLLEMERQGSAERTRILEETVMRAESLAYQLDQERIRAQSWRERVTYLESGHDSCLRAGHTVRPNDWKLLVALASRKHINQSPDDYLTLLIQRQAEQAGVAVEDDGA